MITNGWAYVMMGVGSFLGIGWMVAVSGAYFAFLWFPFTPEKIVSIIIAIFLLKVLFPKDERTLSVLIDFNERTVKKYLLQKKRKRMCSERKREDSAKATISEG